MIHVYCGEGKGKTSAAMGLALRGINAGWKVVIVQFLKGSESGEIAVLKNLPNVTVLRGKQSSKFSFQMNEAELAAARVIHDENLAQALTLVEGGACNMLILDESLGALSKDLLDEETLRSLLVNRGDELEIVLTGRGVPPFVEDAADYITEMKCQRHPYEEGVAARKGVEF